MRKVAMFPGNREIFILFEIIFKTVWVWLWSFFSGQGTLDEYQKYDLTTDVSEIFN